MAILTPTEMFDPAKFVEMQRAGLTDAGNAAAGNALANGDMTGASNAFAKYGNVADALKLQEMQQEREARGFKALGAMVRSVQSPEQFEQAKAAARSVYGPAVDKYDFTHLPALKAQFLDADREYALKQREVGAKETAARQRFIPAGNNVFDAQTNQWLQGPVKPGTFQDKVVTLKDAATGYDTSAVLGADGQLQRIDPTELPSFGGQPVAPAAGGNAAPRMPKILRDQLLKQDAKAVDTYREQAAAALDLRSSVDELEAYRAKTGYEGSWQNNALFRTIGRNLGGGLGIIPERKDVEALDAMAAPATNLQLGFTSKTKGAISDREMGLFASAVPSGQMTDAAAKSVIAAQRAAIQRTEEKAIFYEHWLAAYGSGRGWQEAWTRFTDANPVIQKDERGNIVVNAKNIANWQKYLGVPSSAPQVAAKRPEGVTDDEIPSSAPQVAAKRPKGVTDDEIVAEARQAVAKGADANAVRARLKQMGIEF